MAGGGGYGGGDVTKPRKMIANVYQEYTSSDDSSIPPQAQGYLLGTRLDFATSSDCAGSASLVKCFACRIDLELGTCAHAAPVSCTGDGEVAVANSTIFAHACGIILRCPSTSNLIMSMNIQYRNSFRFFIYINVSILLTAL